MRGSGESPAAAPAAAAKEPAQEQQKARVAPAKPDEIPAVPVDLESSSGVATWWITAILVYAIMLFGVALAYRSPPEGVALGLLAVEIVAAYFVNRAIWRRARRWSVARVRKLVIYLAATVAVLMVLVWVRRRFLG